MTRNYTFAAALPRYSGSGHETRVSPMRSHSSSLSGVMRAAIAVILNSISSRTESRIVWPSPVSNQCTLYPVRAQMAFSLTASTLPSFIRNHFRAVTSDILPSAANSCAVPSPRDRSITYSLAPQVLIFISQVIAAINGIFVRHVKSVCHINPHQNSARGGVNMFKNMGLHQYRKNNFKGNCHLDSRKQV